jgi:hypothetical protein
LTTVPTLADAPRSRRRLKGAVFNAVYQVDVTRVSPR